jgi:hypothetical protein
VLATYMLNFLHDFHLILYLLVEHAILHELAFVEFFSSIRRTIIFGGYFVHRSEGAFADDADPCILFSTAPLPRYALKGLLLGVPSVSPSWFPFGVWCRWEEVELVTRQGQS